MSRTFGGWRLNQKIFKITRNLHFIMRRQKPAKTRWIWKVRREHTTKIGLVHWQNRHAILSLTWHWNDFCRHRKKTISFFPRRTSPERIEEVKIRANTNFIYPQSAWKSRSSHCYSLPEQKKTMPCCYILWLQGIPIFRLPFCLKTAYRFQELRIWPWYRDPGSTYAIFREIR